MVLKGLLVTGHRGDALHHQLVLPDDCAAGVALFAGSRTAPESWQTVMRQTTVLELLADEDTNRLGFHNGFTGEPR